MPRKTETGKINILQIGPLTARLTLYEAPVSTDDAYELSGIHRRTLSEILDFWVRIVFALIR